MPIKCDNCGRVRKKVMFVIGASKKPDWCMIEGTGKMSCPDCYEKMSLEGQDAIDRHVKYINSRA